MKSRAVPVKETHDKLRTVSSLKTLHYKETCI